MKQFFLLVLLATIFFCIKSNAQVASSTWVLTTDGVPAIVGNVTAGTIDTATLTSTGFLGHSFGTGGLKVAATGPTNWPADGSTTTANSAFTGLSNGTVPRYIQFTISPTAGNNLTINSITVPLTENGSATNINAALGYSSDGTNYTTFNSNGLTGNALPSNTLQTFTATPYLVVGSSGAVTIRIILWRKATSTASSSSVTIGTVVLSGTTASAIAPSITVSSHGPLNFGVTTVGTPTASQNFTVSGINMTNDLIVTPPSGYEIRTGVNAFSTSPVTLVQSGGSVGTTTIDVRFNPITTGYNSANVACTSTGAIEQDVVVTGTVPINYYSKSSGNLDVLSTWTTDPNGGAGSAPSDFTTPAEYFYVRNNNSPTIGSNWTISGIASKVIIGDGSNTCTFTVPSSVHYSALATDIATNGKFVLQDSASFATIGSLTVANGGTYQHDCNGPGINMTGSFLTGSTISVTGITTQNLWLPTSCYNVLWNSPAQTANGKIYNTDGTLTIGGNLVMQSTGTGHCAVNTGGGIRTLNLAGNLDIQGGSFRLLALSTGSGSVTANVGGNVLVSDAGSALNISASTNASAGAVNLNVQGNILHTAGTFTNSSNYGSTTITFNGPTAQQFSTIGLSGGINFVINNSSGVTMNTPATIKGSLTLTNGLLNTTSTNLLTLSSSASVVGGNTSSFVNGPMACTMAKTALDTLVFPVGKGSAYRPLNLILTQSDTVSTLYTAEQFSGAPTSRTLPSSLTSVSAVRYYRISKGTGANVTSASVQLSYNTDDLVTDATALRIAKDDGAGNWMDLGGSGSANTVGTITSAVNFNTFSDFVLAKFSGRSLFLTALIEGFFNGSTMVSDTVTVELHNAGSPYALVESKKGVLNSSGAGSIGFTTAANGTPYYIVLKHRNALETWSASAQTFTSSVLNYDFTTAASQAYGGNQQYKDGKYCLFSGDVTHDGSVDLSDLIDIDNDNSNFVSGYTLTDVNGDGTVDLSDLIFVDNNNSAFISKIVPSGAPSVNRVHRTSRINNNTK
jgi:hypothetical protein